MLQLVVGLLVFFVVWWALLLSYTRAKNRLMARWLNEIEDRLARHDSIGNRDPYPGDPHFGKGER